VFSEDQVRAAFKSRTGLTLRENGRWRGDAVSPYPAIMCAAVGDGAPRGEFRVTIDDAPCADVGVRDRGFGVNHAERGPERLIVGASAERANVRVAWWPEEDPASEDPGDEARAHWGRLIAFLGDL
jgi:hypothetical protein